MHPDPYKEIISARYFKDHPKFRAEVITMYTLEEEKGPGPGGGGMMPKNHKPLCVAEPILWDNGHCAKGVNGNTMYIHPYRKVKLKLPSLTRAKYDEIRKRYLLDE